MDTLRTTPRYKGPMKLVKYTEMKPSRQAGHLQRIKRQSWLWTASESWTLAQMPTKHLLQPLANSFHCKRFIQYIDDKRQYQLKKKNPIKSWCPEKSPWLAWRMATVMFTYQTPQDNGTGCVLSIQAMKILVHHPSDLPASAISTSTSLLPSTPISTATFSSPSPVSVVVTTATPIPLALAFPLPFSLSLPFPLSLSVPRSPVVTVSISLAVSVHTSISCRTWTILQMVHASCSWLHGYVHTLHIHTAQCWGNQHPTHAMFYAVNLRIYFGQHAELRYACVCTINVQKSKMFSCGRAAYQG